VKVGERKKGGSSSHWERPEVVARGKGGARGAVGVAWELREEKGGLSAFCAEATLAPGGGKGGPASARHTEESGEGSGTGATHSEGGAR
jgi:hypothetical protein